LLGLSSFFCGFALAFLYISCVLRAPRAFFFNKIPYYLLKKKEEKFLYVIIMQLNGNMTQI
jgi:hypothetical protein